jgi:O-antigen/teichoic acid export membrane protein
MVLPPILVRHMPLAAYAVWILILQVVGYLGYLDFGLQTAVGRYIAFADEKKDADLRDGVFSTAVIGLAIAALLGFAVILVAAAACRLIFPSIPVALGPPMRIAILIVGFSVALGLPASAWNGIFVGLQRYEIPAITTGTCKLLSAAGLIWAALTGKSLVFMAMIVAAANLFSYALQFGAVRRVASNIRFRVELITRSMIRELWEYCFSLTVWSFGMLLVGGLSLILVGRFQFSAVAPYGISATLIAFLAGLQNAIFGVLIPHAAGLHANQDSKAIGNLLIKTTKLGVLLLLLTGLPLIVFASPIVGAWIGPQFAQIGGSILTILVFGHLVRLIGTPYATILIGTGQQRLVLISPLMEGVSNLVASVLLGLKYGAIGVAWGTLIGAVVGMLTHVVYNIPRTRQSIDVSQYRFIRDGVIIPAACGAPVVAALLLSFLGSLAAKRALQPCLLLSCLACVILIVRTAGSWRQLRLATSISGG